MHPLIQPKERTPLFFITLALLFGLLPIAQAVTPAPDGGYAHYTTAEGENALLHLTTGVANTAIGALSLTSDTNGNYNVGVGGGALALNNGDSNTAVGTVALFLNTTGTRNTATGTDTLVFNSTGNDNTAVGTFALEHNTASGNTAIGSSALVVDTTGSGNTIIGASAAITNTTGNDNTGVGLNVLFSNTTGDYNTAVGRAALGANTSAGYNTAVGWYALSSDTTGPGNTAIGYNALAANNTGDANTALGYNSGGNVVTADSVLCIGAGIGGADVSNTTWIANVYGVATLNGSTAPVIVSADGQLGTVVSSERFKKDIAPMDKASDAILSLRPVTFHYKSDVDDFPQFGLIAEEVAKVNPALVLPDNEGKPYTVRYDAVNAMLLNEFLKEHKTVEEQGVTIARLEKQIGALTAGLQKVSAQLELIKSAPQTVLNDQ